MGEDAFASAWDAGRRLSLEEATELALAAAPLTPDVPPVGPAINLSPREREVLRLLVDGQTNQEIAAVLFISPRTVESHVANILGKLGLDSRAAVAVYAVRQGLV